MHSLKRVMSVILLALNCLISEITNTPESSSVGTLHENICDSDSSYLAWMITCMSECAGGRTHARAARFGI